LQLSVESSGGTAPPVQAADHEKKKLTVALECWKCLPVRSLGEGGWTRAILVYSWSVN